MKRRNFLQLSALASGSILIPQFLKGSQHFLPKRTQSNGKTLVVIQLSGGNDGLNTIVPYRNDDYYRLRPRLGIPQNEVLKLTDELGLNPMMTGLRQLYDNGEMSIINNVGYPNPNRSHFRSMEIWQTGSDANEYLSSGWLGRYLDATCSGSCTTMHHGIEVDSQLSLAMKGEKVKGIAVQNPKQLHQVTKHDFYQDVAQTAHHDHHHDHENLAYLYKTMIETANSAEYIHSKSRVYPNKATYPQNKLARSLKTIAQLIAADIDTSVFYVSFGSFDTHANQKNQQNRLLKNYSEAVTAFVKDLKAYRKLDEVMIFTFSEFGRRVAENASGGTDHGAANNVFLMGGQLEKAGFYNAPPNLKKLDQGDLMYDVDFRDVYANLLGGWLGVNAKNILKK